MKVPWFLVILLSLVTVGVVWSIGTAKYDFLTPPEELAPLPPIALPPTLASLPTFQSQGGAAFSNSPGDAPGNEALPTDLSTFDEPEVGDLSFFPGLNLFVDLSKNHPAGRLLQLSSLLQAQGENTRAALALERVLEHPDASADERAQATANLFALKSSTQPWNIDPSAALPLTLNIQVTAPLPPNLKDAVKAIGGRINEASDGILRISPQILVRKAPKTAPDAPVRRSLTFQLVGDRGKSPLSIIRLPLAEEVTLEDELARTLTATLLEIHGQAATSEENSTLAVVPRDLEERTTRLQWRDFGLTLTHPPTTPAPGPSEPDEEQ